MKILQASFETIVLRYFLLMGVIIASFLSGYWLVGTILALPVFMSAILGVVFWESKKSVSPISQGIKNLNPEQMEQAA